MKKECAILAAALLLALPCSGIVPEVAEAGENLIGYLPEPSETQAWKRAEEPQVYLGRDLFLLVNGGAELYFEYGFETAIAVTYENPARKWVALEIYQMKDDGGAFGIYTSKRGDSGDLLPIGNEAMITGYYLNFWKGPFVVTLTGGDGAPETMEALTALARSVDGKIRERGEVPSILHLLPDESAAEGTRTYVRGKLGFNKHSSVRTPCSFAVEEAVVASYGEVKAHILKYRDAGESEDAFLALFRCLKGTEMPLAIGQGGGRVTVQDGKDQGLLVEREGSYVILITKAESSRAKEVLGEIKKRIQSGSS